MGARTGERELLTRVHHHTSPVRAPNHLPTTRGGHAAPEGTTNRYVAPRGGPTPSEVPLADEIREARRAVDRAQKARLDLAEIEVAIANLAIDPDHAVDPVWAGGFPERWPEYPVVPTDRTLLLAMRNALSSLGEALTPASARLHHLQHEQHTLLAKPENAALRAEIDEQLAVLGALGARRAPLLQRAAALPSVIAMLGSAVGELGGGDEAHAKALIAALVASAAPVFAVLGIDDGDLVALGGEGADPAGAVEGIRSALAEQLDRTNADLATVDAEYTALNDRLLGWMG